MLEEEDRAGLEGGARGEPLPALESSLLEHKAPVRLRLLC